MSVSKIEMQRWLNESKMFVDDYPIYAVNEETNEKFNISGCIKDGEQMILCIKKRS